jgi:flagellar motor switch protein FliG
VISYDQLTGKQKAAILLVALGVETASRVFKNLRERDIEELSLEIANLQDIPSEVIDQVVEEFYQMVKVREYIIEGGLEYAQRLLEQSIGGVKAYEIVHRVQTSISTSGFNMLKHIDPAQLAGMIQAEHPQTIALILTHLEPRQAALVLSRLPRELQEEVAFRIGTMEKISSELLQTVEETLTDRLEGEIGGELNEAGGAIAVAEILNNSSKTVERSILEAIEQHDPLLAQEIRNLMFTYEDILLLDDRSIQRVLKEVDSKILAVALKGSSNEVRQKFFNNMSERAANMIREEIELMGPTRVKVVEEAQREIVSIVRNLEEEGEIVIMGRGDSQEEFIV